MVNYNLQVIHQPFSFSFCKAKCFKTRQLSYHEFSLAKGRDWICCCSVFYTATKSKWCNMWALVFAVASLLLLGCEVLTHCPTWCKQQSVQLLSSHFNTSLWSVLKMVLYCCFHCKGPLNSRLMTFLLSISLLKPLDLQTSNVLGVIGIEHVVILVKNWTS